MSRSTGATRARAPAPVALRLRISLVFAVLNVLLWAGLLVYAYADGGRLRREFEQSNRRLTERTSDAISSTIVRLLQEKVAPVVLATKSEKRLFTALQEIDFWDDAAFRRYVQKAVLVRKSPGQADTFYNPRSALIFDPGTLDRRAARDLVSASLVANDVRVDGTHVAGPIKVDGRPWGGVYLSVVDVGRELFDRDPFSLLGRASWSLCWAPC